MKRMKSQHPNPSRDRIRFTARATRPLSHRPAAVGAGPPRAVGRIEPAVHPHRMGDRGGPAPADAPLAAPQGCKAGVHAD
jgi:hypothetical protein